MFDRPTRVLWSAIIGLIYIAFGQAHAADASRALSEAHAENATIAANGYDSATAIEEIVVVANKKKRRPNSEPILTTRPTIEKPSRVDFQLLPVYDPEDADRDFSVVQQDEQLQSVGIVTLFRLNFGR